MKRSACGVRPVELLITLVSRYVFLMSWFFLCAVSLATAQASRGSETERDGAGEELGGKTTTGKPDPESKGADSSFPHITRSARE